MEITTTNKQMGDRGRWFFMRAGQWISSLFVVVGLIMLLAAIDEKLLENERLLHQPNAIFGLSEQLTLFLAASFYLLVGIVILIVRGPAIRSMLLFWVSAISVAYRLGLGWLKPGQPCVLITLMAHKLGIMPDSACHLLCVLFIGSISIGIATLILERHRLKQIRENMFMTQYRQYRERRFPSGK